MLLVIAAPFVAELIVLLLHSDSAAVLALQDVPVNASMRRILLEVQFRQTPLSAAAGMLAIFRSYWQNALVAAVFFCAPTVLMLYIAYRGELIRCLKDRIVAGLTAFSPLLILLFAWDLSRFLVMTNFAALVAIFYLCARSLDTDRHTCRRLPARILVPTLLVAAIYLALPTTYLYFNFGITLYGSKPLLRIAALKELGERAMVLYDRR